jgi:hypothetical protein
MSQNIGTLVSSPIRPLSSGMTIPTAFADEIKGGLHSVADLAERNQIPTDRREFGMLVYTEASDEFYQLKQIVTTDLFDNLNWQLLAIGPSASFTSEWQDSVISRKGDPTLLVPTNGDRYLIVTGVNGWLGKDDQVAEFTGTWSYTLPTEGMSLRVDDDQGPVYSYLSGSWLRQEFVTDPLYPHWNIPTGTTVSVSTQSMYLSYGDLQIDGLLNNFGKVVLLNGTISGSGSINNIGSGSVQQVDLVSNIYGGTGINITQPSLGTRTIEIDIVAGTGIGISTTGSSVGVYALPNDPVFTQWTITASQTMSVPDYQHYFIYGDLEVFGTLDIGTFARVVVLNGTFSAATGSTIINPGNIELYDLAMKGVTGSIGPAGPTGSMGVTGSQNFEIYMDRGEVSGTGKLSTNTGDDSVMIGVGSGSASTGINDSVLIGRDAGGSTPGVTGSVLIGKSAGKNDTYGYNVLIGHEAGMMGSGIGNVFIGVSAGLSSSTTQANTFLGAYSGQFNGIGDNNVFIGYESGSENSTGGCNTFVGVNSGCANGTGRFNTFIGYSAGHYNTDCKNTFIGFSSGCDNTTGCDNTFIGFSSGLSNDDGFENTFMGSFAGYSNTSGDCNTFMGHESGFSNTTGSLNTYVGARAGRQGNGVQNAYFGRDAGLVATGNNNTFIGYSSGVSNAGGGQNTFLGFNSGGSNVSGGYNVAVGFGAGGVHGSSHSIFIGAESYVQPGSSFSNNSIALGYKAIVSTGSQFVVGSTFSPIGTSSTVGATYGYLELTLNNVDVKIPLYNI